ncbi:MAG: hypothetical protein JWN89_752 [Parcubacteria group bacterium]|nr:hypothetical protein [Parcubacteria group bacterium]
MNKGLSFDGKEYISASRAAEKLSYAQDYIGALIRTGKVPGRMIGRSWYVDYDSLLAHKKGRKIKKEKSQNNFQTEVPSQAKIEYEDLLAANEEIPLMQKAAAEETAMPLRTFFKYEQDVQPRLPELSKPHSSPIRKGNFVQRTAIAVAVITLIISSLPLMEHASPRLSDKFNSGVASSMAVLETGSNHAASILGLFNIEMAPFLRKMLGFEPKVVPALTGEPLVTEAQTAGGLVVLPTDENHDAEVARIQSAFSDPVAVLADTSGDSGVITPVFHPGDDTRGYTYVLVPIQSKTQ